MINNFVPVAPGWSVMHDGELRDVVGWWFAEGAPVPYPCVQTYEGFTAVTDRTSVEVAGYVKYGA
jgi:hypothetical protein